jgi:hypothetical protein
MVSGITIVINHVSITALPDLNIPSKGLFYPFQELTGDIALGAMSRENQYLV